MRIWKLLMRPQIYFKDQYSSSQCGLSSYEKPRSFTGSDQPQVSKMLRLENLLTGQSWVEQIRRADISVKTTPIPDRSRTMPFLYNSSQSSGHYKLYNNRSAIIQCITAGDGNSSGGN